VAQSQTAEVSPSDQKSSAAESSAKQQAEAAVLRIAMLLKATHQAIRKSCRKTGPR